MPNNNNKQSYSFLLTINNPVEHGFDHEAIKRNLIDNFTTLQYFCMADEIGSTPHTHIYVCFRSRVRFSTVKRHFKKAHIDACKGTASDNIAYVQKSGKWADDKKHETVVEGTFEEFGDRPSDSKGKKIDMTELYHMIGDGMTTAEILAVNQDYILHIDKIEKVRTVLLQEKYKNERRLDIHVVYVYGVTRSGKTRGILDKYGDANVYRVTDYKHPFDGYNYDCGTEFARMLDAKGKAIATLQGVTAGKYSDVSGRSVEVNVSPEYKNYYLLCHAFSYNLCELSNAFF